MTKPRKPSRFFIDADIVAYKGASSAQETVYVWTNKETQERSPEFTKAKDAQEWLEQLFLDESEEHLWERSKDIRVLPFEKAISATEQVIDDYKKTVRKFKNPDKKVRVKGWLTPSGLKDKDIKGLEDRYQYNRLNTVKPHHPPAVREWMLANCKWLSMAKQGFEADSHVVGMAEAAGEDGCTMSGDKDIDQVEGAWHINMNEPSHRRQPEFATELGRLWQLQTARGKKKTKGDGFMFLCYQAIVGDPSDGYKGLIGTGDAVAYKALKDCQTKIECVLALEQIYKAKAAKGYLCKKVQAFNEEQQDANKIYPITGMFIYLSWDGELQYRTPHELMQQHFTLAYQERSPDDTFKLEDYIATFMEPSSEEILKGLKQNAKDEEKGC